MPLPTRQRRTGLIALAVLLIVGFGLAGALLYTRAGAKTAVLVMARPVAVGEVIQAGDLSTVSLAGAGVRAIAESDRGIVEGRTAVVSLVRGQVLNRDMITDRPPFTDKQAVVGLSLKPGQLPAGLGAGATVAVVQLPAKDQASGKLGTASLLVEKAQVLSVQDTGTGGGGTVVTVVVDAAVAPSVAAAGNADQAAVVQVTP